MPYATDISYHQADFFGDQRFIVPCHPSRRADLNGCQLEGHLLRFYRWTAQLSMVGVRQKRNVLGIFPVNPAVVRDLSGLDLDRSDPVREEENGYE